MRLLILSYFASAGGNAFSEAQQRAALVETAWRTECIAACMLAAASQKLAKVPGRPEYLTAQCVVFARKTDRAPLARPSERCCGGTLLERFREGPWAENLTWRIQQEFLGEWVTLSSSSISGGFAAISRGVLLMSQLLAVKCCQRDVFVQ